MRNNCCIRTVQVVYGDDLFKKRKRVTRRRYPDSRFANQYLHFDLSRLFTVMIYFKKMCDTKETLGQPISAFRLSRLFTVLRYLIRGESVMIGMTSRHWRYVMGDKRGRLYQMGQRSQHQHVKDFQLTNSSKIHLWKMNAFGQVYIFTVMC